MAPKKEGMNVMFRTMAIHILKILGFLFIVYLIGTVFFFFYRGAPFSWYFFVILWVYFIINTIDHYLAGKFKNIYYSHNNSISLAIFRSLLSSSRVLCVSIFPILLFQISVKFLYEMDLNSIAMSFDSWIIKLDRSFDLIQAKKYLGWLLFTILIAGLFVKGRSSIFVSRTFKGISLITLLTFISSFSFFTVIAFDKSEKVWRAEKIVEIHEYETKIIKHINEGLVLQSMISSSELQRELIKVVTSILATITAHELMPISVRKAIYGRVSMLPLPISINGMKSTQENSVKIVYPVGLYDPYYVVKYSDTLQDAYNSRIIQNWNAKRSIRELLNNVFIETLPSVPDDLRKVTVDTLISVMTDINMVLLERSQGPLRMMLLQAYLGATEPITDRMTLEEFDKNIIKLVRSIDEVYLKNVNTSVIEGYTVQSNRKIDWSERLVKIGKSVVQSL